MADIDTAALQQANAEQAALIRQLNERLEALESRVPAPEPEPVPAGVRLEFPRAVYRATELDDDEAKKQVDVPGNDIMIVNGGDELESAIKAGWKLQPVAVVAKKGKK